MGSPTRWIASYQTHNTNLLEAKRDHLVSRLRGEYNPQRVALYWPFVTFFPNGFRSANIKNRLIV